MELTKDNYYDIETQILKDIEECDFIAFDLEFSGLIQNKSKIYDSPEEYFTKLKYNAENFRIIQLGITIFKKVKKIIKNILQNLIVFMYFLQKNKIIINLILL